MRRSPLLRLTLGAAALAAGTGCVSAESTVRAQFSRAQSCPTALVTVAPVNGTSYRVTGCGRQVVYVCTAFGRAASVGELRCVEQGARDPAPTGERVRPPEPAGIFPAPSAR